jgi:hypothetical protein
MDAAFDCQIFAPSAMADGVVLGKADRLLQNRA